MAKADDDVLASYAQRAKAAVVSHDRAFAAWRSRNTIDQHVWLACPDLYAAPVLARHLDVVVEILERHPNVVVRVKARSVRVTARWR